MKPSSLIAIDLSDRKLAAHVMRVWWKSNIGSQARRPFVPDAIKGLKAIKKDYSSLTVGF